VKDMRIRNEEDLAGIKKISEVVALVLKEMKAATKPGVTTMELDNLGRDIMLSYGAKSAPFSTYKFPGWTCISLNEEIAHGIPSDKKLIMEGDLVNIDVSAELNGYWSDNAASFVVGEDIYKYQSLVDASMDILAKAISNIKGNINVADIGGLIENEAKLHGFKVIKNLTGHGVGKKLHEKPQIENFYNHQNKAKFKKNSVVAVETFISTISNYVAVMPDGWTLVGRNGGFIAQHEHSILITEDKPVILTIPPLGK
jgi:methionyl aminopeptidase